jgi:hypothetical protein
LEYGGQENEDSMGRSLAVARDWGLGVGVGVGSRFYVNYAALRGKPGDWSGKYGTGMF